MYSYEDTQGEISVDYYNYKELFTAFEKPFGEEEEEEEEEYSSSEEYISGEGSEEEE